MTTEKAQVRPSIPTARIVTDERLIEMKVGETRELKATAIPLLAKNAKFSSGDADSLLSSLVKIQWSSNDAKIASVNENGKLSAHKEGSCKVTVKSGELEVIFNILVEVAIPDWASEEFLAYIERIGAYTELPLGTDGSAGTSAQYVTFGFERPLGEYYHYTELGKIDTRTETTYKGYTYAKGADDDDWYWAYDWTCWDSSHGHEPREAYYACKIKPRKWRLLDKQKGLMVMESYEDTGINYSYKFRVDIARDFTDDFKDDINGMSNICDYETSHLRAWLDGGRFVYYSPYYYLTNNGEIVYENGKKKYWGRTQLIECYMNEPIIFTDLNGKYREWAACTNKRNEFENFLAPGQSSQIKEVDLDCGEGGNTKGRLFILSEDEIKQYYYNSNTPIFLPYAYGGMTFWTRTRKKVDGKYRLCGFEINSDGTLKEFVQFEGYDTGDYHYFIPAICVPQQ